MTITVGLSARCALRSGGRIALRIACQSTVFPCSGKPRFEAVSEEPSGVQGLTPGTLFLRQEKKPSVFGFFLKFPLSDGGS